MTQNAAATGSFARMKEQEFIRQHWCASGYCHDYRRASRFYHGRECKRVCTTRNHFIHLIKMLVIPLVLVSIISGAASLGDSPSAVRLASALFGFFIVTSGIAVVLALVMGNLFQPGAGVDFTAHSSSDLMEVTKEHGALPG